MGAKNSSVRQREWVHDPWMWVLTGANGLPTSISEEKLSEGTATPQDTGYNQEVQLEKPLSEGRAPLKETGCEAQLEEILSEGTAPPEDTNCGTQLALTTNEIDPVDETGTERSGDDQEECVPPCHGIGVLQAVPYTTPDQLSESASDPVIATDMDPGDETRTERSGDDYEEHVVPCHEIGMLQLQAVSCVTSQQVSQSASDPVINEIDPGDETERSQGETKRSEDDHEEHVPSYHNTVLTPQQVSESASDSAVATNGIDPVDETEQGKGDKEKIPPRQESDTLQPIQHETPRHDTDGEYSNPMIAAGSNLISIRPQSTDPERAKAVAAKDTLQAHSYNLSKCIKSSALASRLYSKKIINSEDYERASNPVYGTERERALIILVKVIQQLERKPNWFDTVCDLLKKEGVSIRKLKRDYQQKYDELTQGQAEQGNVGLAGATESTGTKPSEVLTSDSESGSEVGSNSPTLEMQGPALLPQACGGGSSMTVQPTQPVAHGTIPTENDGTLLHLAVDHGYCNLFDVLRSHLTKTDVNAQDKKGRTPLHVACLAIDPENPVQRHMHEVVIPNLLESGARTDIVDEDRQTALHLACQKNDARTAEMLLRHNIECLRVQNKNKDTPLHIACRNGALDVVDVLLKQKADPHIQNKDGYTPLHLACANIEVARRLVSYDHSTVDGIDQNQNTPLHLACQKTVTNATHVVLLLNGRIDKYNSDGFTTLHLASSCGNRAVVKQLLKHCRTDSYVNCQNKKNGDTALHLACQNGFEDVVSLLLKSKYKTKRERRNFANKTPIDVARENCHTAVVQCLDPRPSFFFRHKKFRKTY